MTIKQVAEKLELKPATKIFDKDVTGVYMSDMVSDVIANAKAGNLLVTVQIHNNVIAAANLVDMAAIIVTQGKQPSADVIKMAEKAEITILSTTMNGWQVASKLFEIGIR